MNYEPPLMSYDIPTIMPCPSCEKAVKVNTKIWDVPNGEDDTDVRWEITCAECGELLDED